MARKPTPRSEFVLFNVYYEDGTQRSNRKVPADILGGIDGDEPGRALIAGAGSRDQRKVRHAAESPSSGSCASMTT